MSAEVNSLVKSRPLNVTWGDGPRPPSFSSAGVFLSLNTKLNRHRMHRCMRVSDDDGGERVEFQSGEFERNEEAIIAVPRLAPSFHRDSRSVLNYCRRRLSPPNSFGKRRQYREVKCRQWASERGSCRCVALPPLKTRPSLNDIVKIHARPRPPPRASLALLSHVSSNRGYRPCKAGKNTVSGCCYRLSFLQPSRSISLPLFVRSGDFKSGGDVNVAIPSEL